MRKNQKVFLVFVFCLLKFSVSGQLYKLAKTVRDFSSNPCLMLTKPDEPVLVQANTDGSIIFRSAITGLVDSKVSAHSKAIGSLDFNTTNNLLISTSVNGEIRVYDFAEKKIINKL